MAHLRSVRLRACDAGGNLDTGCDGDIVPRWTGRGSRARHPGRGAARRDDRVVRHAPSRRRRRIAPAAFSWDFDLGLRPSVWGDAWKGFLAIHRDANGTLDGYARYTPDGTWERRQPRVVARVDELHTSTDDAYRNLWRYLAEIDWVATVRAGRRRLTERLPWLLTNARAASLGESGDDLWVRLLDIRRALESRIYETEGRIVMEVMDAEAPGGRMRLALDAGPGGATCRATDASPDLTVGVSALAAAYLGGTRLRDAVLARPSMSTRTGARPCGSALPHARRTLVFDLLLGPPQPGDDGAHDRECRDSDQPAHSDELEQGVLALLDEP